jgi:NifU-like protein involved in Fe-S cluster formation
MSDPLYRRELLRLAADAHGAGRLSAPDATGHAYNPTCGDRVVVDLAFADGRVSQIAHDTRACVLAQASASILGQSLNGADRVEIEELRNAVASMLDRDTAPPESPFAAFAAFSGAVEFKNRHRCVLLPLDAVLEAFAASEAGEPGGVGSDG